MVTFLLIALVIITAPLWLAVLFGVAYGLGIFALVALVAVVAAGILGLAMPSLSMLGEAAWPYLTGQNIGLAYLALLLGLGSWRLWQHVRPPADA